MTIKSKLFDITCNVQRHVANGGGPSCGFLFTSSDVLTIDTGFQGVVFRLVPTTIFFRRVDEGKGDLFVANPDMEPTIRSCECYLGNTQDTKFNLNMQARYQMGAKATAFTPWSTYHWSNTQGWSWGAAYTEAALGQDARTLVVGTQVKGKIEIQWQIPEFIDDSYVFDKDTKLIATLWKN